MKELRELDLFVCTYNSGETLGSCLTSLRLCSPSSRIIVIDHMSGDSTLEICRRHGVTIYQEDVGLGHARQMCFALADSDFLAFVDSDVEVKEKSFFARAISELSNPEVGAVAGMAMGHSLAYGLPASLLVLRTSDFKGIMIPDYIDARETYFIQERLDAAGLKTVYLGNAMAHRSGYRRFKPEWEGANTRLACGLNSAQLLFALRVIVLMSLNSRNPRNMAYVPIFYLKFLRGFVNPGQWRKLSRKPVLMNLR